MHCIFFTKLILGMKGMQGHNKCSAVQSFKTKILNYAILNSSLFCVVIIWPVQYLACPEITWSKVYFLCSHVWSICRYTKVWDHCHLSIWLCILPWHTDTCSPYSVLHDSLPVEGEVLICRVDGGSLSGRHLLFAFIQPKQRLGGEFSLVPHYQMIIATINNPMYIGNLTKTALDWQRTGLLLWVLQAKVYEYFAISTSSHDNC